MAERSDGDGRERSAALGLSETAPDSVRLFDLEGVRSAVTDNRADLADRLRPYLSSLAFVLAFLSGGGKEQVGVIAAAQGDRLPGTVE